MPDGAANERPTQHVEREITGIRNTRMGGRGRVGSKEGREVISCVSVSVITFLAYVGLSNSFNALLR